MATQPAVAAPSGLPDYLVAAKPNPVSNRAPWYKNTAPTYAGIFLWFAFWDTVSGAGGLAQGGLVAALVGIVIAALICHFCFYLVPGLLGMKTGLPLYIVGSSTFGATGGLILPGFLMGVLQFGWLAVNTYFSSLFLAEGIFGKGTDAAAGAFYPICVVWAVAAAFIGLKGIQYVAKVATYLPLIPLGVLILGLCQYGMFAGDYEKLTASPDNSDIWFTVCAMVAYIVGFFATAGAAGVDFGMNNRDGRDVQWGGLVGIVLAIIFTAGASTIIVAGARAHMPPGATGAASYAATDYLKAPYEDQWLSRLILIGLPIAALPGACFSSFIAANSFKTVMPRVNPFVSVSVGTLVSIVLAVTGWAGKLGVVFGLIGASFGPICGAMLMDYLHSGRRWAGPRAAFNPAGWIAWLLGFIVGILPNEMVRGPLTTQFSAPWVSQITSIPAAPVAAFIVGALVYFILASLGVQTRVLPYGPAAGQRAEGAQAAVPV